MGYLGSVPEIYTTPLRGMGLGEKVCLSDDREFSRGRGGVEDGNFRDRVLSGNMGGVEGRPRRERSLEH